MSFGFNVFNPQGQIVVSSDRPIFHFLGKFVMTGTQANNITCTFPCTTTPLCFIEGVDGKVACTHALVNNGNGTWTVWGTRMSPNRTNVDMTFNVYIFEVPATSSPSGFGLRVFNSAGAPTFDGTRRVLKITGIHTTTASTSGQLPANQTLTSGTIATNWAIACPPVGMVWVASTWLHALGAGRVSGSIGFGTAQALAVTTPGAGGSGHSLYAGQSMFFIDTSLYQ